MQRAQNQLLWVAAIVVSLFAGWVAAVMTAPSAPDEDFGKPPPPRSPSEPGTSLAQESPLEALLPGLRGQDDDEGLARAKPRTSPADSARSLTFVSDSDRAASTPSGDARPGRNGSSITTAAALGASSGTTGGWTWAPSSPTPPPPGTGDTGQEGESPQPDQTPQDGSTEDKATPGDRSTEQKPAPNETAAAARTRREQRAGGDG